MKRRLLLRGTFLLLAVSVVSCGSDRSASHTDLRGRLVAFPEDYYLQLCETGETLWVDQYALQPWWDQISGTHDGGFPPPLYLDMKAKVVSSGPYGHATKTDRGVIAVDEMRTISTDIPSDCSQ